MKTSSCRINNERYLPHAVGDGGQHLLKVCRASGMTSLYQPDLVNLELFGVLKPMAEVTAQIPVRTSRLDDIADVAELDYLKIDIQGGELAVFEGGRDKLSRAVVIQTEVSFIRLYENQPAFGDIDLELRRQGFVPHCFAAVKTWPIAPCVVNGNPRQPLNQLLEADIVYVRDFARPQSMDDEQLKHLALVAHHCYASIDLTLRCVMVLQQRGALAAGAQERYLGGLRPR